MSSTEYTCAQCNKKYKKAFYYHKHLAEKHGGAGSSNVLTVKVETEGTVKVKTEGTFVCRYCDKKYKSLRGLNKHVLMHNQTGEDSLPPDCNLDQLNPFLEEEGENDLSPEEALVQEGGEDSEELVTLFELEDELEEAALLATAIGVDPDPVPPATAASSKQKKKKETPLALCSTCGTSYFTLTRYMTHRMSHAMADVTAQAPSFEVVKGASKRLASELLIDILDSHPNEVKHLRMCSSCLLEKIDSEETEKLLTSLCVGVYACFSNGTIFLLPSHLREVYLRGAAVLMANKEKRQELLLKLISVLNLVEGDLDLNFFLTTFIRKFSNKVLAFIVHWMVHGNDSPIVKSASLYRESRESIDSDNFKETLHFVGGANVKSVLRCAWRQWGSNDDCKAVIKTLRENFLIKTPQEAEDKEFMSWTLCQDRGKLIKINEEAFNFFFELASIVKPLEKFDGSLYVQTVIEKISTYPKILYLWEGLVKEALPPTVSFKLLHALTTYFCNTWRSGIISRRMDEIETRRQAQALGTGGVAFRSQVVRFRK